MRAAPATVGTGLLVDRVSYLLEQSAGKRVLHLGCTDWPYTETKLKGGALLHGQLQRSARELTGVDLDAEGVECLRRLGFAETYRDNVEQFTAPEVRSRQYDVILAGEIIEHLENPGLFLRAVQQLMTRETELVITTINAYCFFRFLYFLGGNEMVHPDHNYYFSPVVLRKLITRCGLEVTDFRHYAIGREIRDVQTKESESGTNTRNLEQQHLVERDSGASCTISTL